MCGLHPEHQHDQRHLRSEKTGKAASSDDDESSNAYGLCLRIYTTDV